MRARATILIICCSVLLLTNCRVSKNTETQHVVHTTHEYMDSTFITKTELLDTAWINQSLASDSINLELLKQLGTFHIDNDRAHTTIVYNPTTGKIHIDTKCDAAFKAFIKSTYEEFTKRIIKDISLKIDSKIKDKTVEKPSLKYFLIGLLIGFFLAIIIVVILYFSFKSKINKYLTR